MDSRNLFQKELLELEDKFNRLGVTIRNINMNDYENEMIRAKLGKFEAIFPLKNDLKSYSKFFKNSGDDNIILWKYIMSMTEHS